MRQNLSESGVEAAMELQNVEPVQIAAHIVVRPFDITNNTAKKSYLVKATNHNSYFYTDNRDLAELIKKVLNIYANTNRK